MVNPAGPVAERLTGATKPFIGDTETVDVAEAPDTIIRPVELVAREKSGFGAT